MGNPGEISAETAAPASTPLSGKTALVTEAYTGTGKAIAEKLAAQGAQVVIQHPHFPEPAADVVKGITEAGGAALGLAADIADRTEYEELVQALLADCGRWDLLVNTVTVPQGPPFAEIGAEAFDLAFGATVRGVFHGLQLAWQHLAEDGRIVTVCADGGGAVHSAVRGAVEQLGHSVAADFAPRRITVNTVSHGAGAPVNTAAAAAVTEPVTAVAYLMGAADVSGQVLRIDTAAAKPPR